MWIEKEDARFRLRLQPIGSKANGSDNTGDGEGIRTDKRAQNASLGGKTEEISVLVRVDREDGQLGASGINFLNQARDKQMRRG